MRFDEPEVPEIVFPNPWDSALTLLRFADLGLGIDNVQVIEDEECSSRSLGRTGPEMAVPLELQGPKSSAALTGIA
jgi:hypothetical protein